MDHLTPLDAAFLELEEGDASSHMHVGWAMIFDPLPDGRTPPVERVRELLGERLELLPRFQRCLSSQHTAKLSWPTWEPDPSFDIANHVRHAALPEPGGEAELLEWLGDFYSHRLDRARPALGDDARRRARGRALGTCRQGPPLSRRRDERLLGHHRHPRC